MRRAAVLMLVPCLARLAAAQDSVEWRDAAQCVGRVCAVRGTVVETKNDGPVIRLFFDAERRDIYATLVRGWLVTWPDYTGHEVVATGPVDRFHDDVEVMLDDPDEVTVLDATTPTVEPPATVAIPPAAPPPPPLVVTTPTVPAPPTATAPQAPTATVQVPTATAPQVATPEEVQRLRERVHELEDRVRELEQRPAP